MRVAAFNNNYHQFTSSIPLDADYCEITNGDVRYVLRPDNGGLFTFNTYEFSRQLFDYKDTFDYTGNLLDTNQSKTVLFDIRIVMLDGNEQFLTLEVTFFDSTNQRWENPFEEDVFINLSDNDTIPYWIGYPFDYSVISGNDVNRVLVDSGDGDTQTSLNVRPIQTDCDAYYLKWHNADSGYSYYLFQNIGREKFAPKSLGVIREQFSWANNSLELGKRGQRVIDVFENIDYADRELMKSLATSNEVYLYTGTQYDIATPNKFLQVRIDMEVNETNKYSKFSQLVSIILPEEVTRTRI